MPAPVFGQVGVAVVQVAGHTETFWEFCKSVCVDGVQSLAQPGAMKEQLTVQLWGYWGAKSSSAGRWWGAVSCSSVELWDRVRLSQEVKGEQG